MKRSHGRVVGELLGLLLFSCVLPASLKADDVCLPPAISRATVYVPLYSYIYFGDALKPFNLAATVSIRNVDSRRAIEILRADYHNSDGKLLRSFLSKPLSVEPLASYSFKVKESDVEGGSGASVLVIWQSSARVAPPIIESVMIGTALGQGISFSSRGRIVAFE